MLKVLDICGILNVGLEHDVPICMKDRLDWMQLLHEMAIVVGGKGLRVKLASEAKTALPILPCQQNHNRV